MVRSIDHGRPASHRRCCCEANPTRTLNYLLAMQRLVASRRWAVRNKCNGAFSAPSSWPRIHVKSTPKKKGSCQSWRSSHGFASVPLSSPQTSLNSSSIRKEIFDIGTPPSSIQQPTNSSNASYSHNRGYGKIVAVSSQSTPSSPTATHLTDLRHKSPMRLVPSRRSHPKNLLKEPAVLHLSSYGGGLVPGDSLELDIDVRGRDAVLCILTQGGQRIYRPGEQFRKHDSYNYEGMESTTNAVSSSKLCRATLQCTVEPGGTLFYLPDPTVPYHQSSFEERRKFPCQYDNGSSTSMGSIIAVDWYSSGRLLSTGMEGERWAFDYLATRTELFLEEQDPPGRRSDCVLRESMAFDNTVSELNDSTMRTPAAIALGEHINSMATILLHGPTSLPVAIRANALAQHLSSLCTRTRSNFPFGDDSGGSSNDDSLNILEEPPDELAQLLRALGGRVLVSITQIKYNNIGQHQKIDLKHETHMVRILAECNEDVYGVLHHCLKSSSSNLGGLEPYRFTPHG